MTSHSITDGQPFNGLSINGNDIDVKAGRKGSSGPAATFKAGLQLENVMAKTFILSQMPAKLNFAISGDITFTFGSTAVTCKDFHMGRGHNNWWVGAKYCVHIPTTGQMTCACNGILGAKLYLSLGDDDHTFNVRMATDIVV